MRFDIKLYMICVCSCILKQIKANVMNLLLIFECSQGHLYGSPSIPCSTFQYTFRLIEPDDVCQLSVSIGKYVRRCLSIRQFNNTLTILISNSHVLSIFQTDNHLRDRRMFRINLMYLHTMSFIDSS